MEQKAFDRFAQQRPVYYRSELSAETCRGPWICEAINIEEGAANEIYLPETLATFALNSHVHHCIDLRINRDAHPAVCPFKGVNMESLIVAGPFLALPAIESGDIGWEGAVV
jgi:hypothetical protein